MSILRLSLKKGLSMLGGGGLACVVLLAVCLCAVSLHGVFASVKASAIHIDAVMDDPGELPAWVCNHMEDGGNIVIHYVDATTAAQHLVTDSTEGVLTFPEGFTASVMNGDPVFSFVSSPRSASSSYVLERLASAVITYRIRENCILRRMETGASRESSAAQVDAAWQTVTAGKTAGYTVSGQLSTQQAVTPVYLQVYAKASGFVAMLLMFLYASALQWLVLEDAKRVGARLDSMCRGRLLAKGTDLLAMLGIGMAAALVCGVILQTLTLRYLLCFFSYSLFLSGFFLLLSGTLRADGQVQIFVPFLTLVTSLLGGCLFDLSAISAVWKNAALFTPQGLLLHGLQSGSSLPLILLLVAGAASFLLCLLPQREAY